MHEPAGRSSPSLNEPAPLLATLDNLHEPPLGEFPIGAWATIERPLERREKRPQPHGDETVVRRHLPWHADAFFEA
jgi:hypothetical protein